MLLYSRCCIDAGCTRGRGLDTEAGGNFPSELSIKRIYDLVLHILTLSSKSNELFGRLRNCAFLLPPSFGFSDRQAILGILVILHAQVSPTNIHS